MGDAARLRQVLLNLAGNAIKFTERGGVAVIVEPGEQANEIRFQVRDTGIGLKAGDQDRIFLDFEQADGSLTRKFGGTGLGLAISKRIVERMGGRIGVESTPGAGATFSFHRAAGIAPADDREFAAPDLHDAAVLIVGRGGHRGIAAGAPARRLGRQTVRGDRRANSRAAAAAALGRAAGRFAAGAAHDRQRRMPYISMRRGASS